MKRPCLRCGKLAEGSYCTEHQPVKVTAVQRGYTESWNALSRRARQLQPWCSDCLGTEQLTLDHTPEAWRKVAEGKSLTIQDCYDGLLVVRCVACNNRQGKARGYGVTRN